MEESSELTTRMAWPLGKGGPEHVASASPMHLFAMPDNFSLMLTEIETPGDADNDSELVMEDHTKAVQEENDRLRKLLAERDFDLAVLKKKWQEERVTYTAGGSMASDVAATKIVELARKVRDITAELEREKTKSKQLLKALQDHEGNASRSKENAALLEKTSDQNSTQNTVQSAGYRNNYKDEPSSPTMHGPSSAPLLRPIGELGSGGVCKRVAWRSADPSFPSPADLNGRDPSADEGIEERDQQASSELQEVKLMCQEYRLVAQATQVEKEKLLELVTVMNKRLETSASHALQAEQRVQELQQKNVQLEKQLGRASLELHPPRAYGGGSSRKSLMSLPSVSLSQESPGEELKRSVTALKEENATLRQALEEVVRAKEEDLRIYQDIIERTRLAFTDGLRQLR